MSKSSKRTKSRKSESYIEGDSKLGDKPRGSIKKKILVTGLSLLVVLLGIGVFARSKTSVNSAPISNNPPSGVNHYKSTGGSTSTSTSSSSSSSSISSISTSTSSSTSISSISSTKSNSQPSNPFKRKTSNNNSLLGNIDAYTNYTNGYLNMSMLFPTDWVFSEQTQIGFKYLNNVVGKKYLYIPSIRLRGIVPVVDFLSQGIYSSKISVFLVPKSFSNFNINAPYLNFLFSNASLVSRPVNKTSLIKGNTVYYCYYTASSLAQNYYLVQATFLKGSNFVVAVLSSTSSTDQSTNIGILNKMIASVKF